MSCPGDVSEVTLFSVCKVLRSLKLEFILTRHNQKTHLAWTNVNQHSRKIARFLKLFSSYCIIFSKSVVMPRNGGFERRLQSARVVISVDLFSRVVTFIIAVPHIPPLSSALCRAFNYSRSRCCTRVLLPSLCGGVCWLVLRRTGMFKVR